jgi:hypothetical protein
MSGLGPVTGTSCKCIAKNKLQVITSENRKIIFNISGKWAATFTGYLLSYSN